MKPHHLPAQRRRRGSYLVEFSLVLTLLLVIVFGIVNFGLAAWSYNTLSEAAREGARYGSVLGNSDGVHTTASARQRIREKVRAFSMGMPFDEATVSWDTGENSPGSTVTVTLRYQFSSTMPFIGPLAIPLSSTASMTISH
ncbi:TadE/TadG family type IV pilus assembly protein [Janthinobacterium fluminis]|uniref:TadE/TadG family type IV pilus assembly protein n=1 Tax=Janthinobacterium fluminis TaxID=2987524 RepID=A0ABT5K0N4_9BURK|nr:TadE/TadG family type IV pilus assembly protein [Janthinobacterium fluminis]MDC8758020.1 TadE/TadG family type IV pilus assembly protein [Janthinobacterium fluminis]